MTRPLTLCDAAKSNDVAQLRQLLEDGADLNERDARGYSALMMATYVGHTEAFDFLLAKGADPHSADLAGNTVLMGAAFKGHLDLVRRLLDAGADPRIKNAAGMDALGFATTFGRDDVAALLHERTKAERGRTDRKSNSNR